jgi:hypothetical protein
MGFYCSLQGGDSVACTTFGSQSTRSVKEGKKERSRSRREHVQVLSFSVKGVVSPLFEQMVC